jgi:hypothetical protein
MKNTLHSLTYKGAQYYPSLGNTVHLLEEKVPGYTSYGQVYDNTTTKRKTADKRTSFREGFYAMK